MLRHVEGLPYAEVAEILGRPVGTVKTHVHRGVRQLREKLEAREERHEMMNTTDTYDPDGGWRELAEGLHGLRAEPPATLAPAVLERVGLSDAYLSVDGPAGPLLVAYNGRGISATAPGADEARFLERFQARFGRPLRPAGRPPERLVAQVERLLTPGRPAPPATTCAAPPSSSGPCWPRPRRSPAARCGRTPGWPASSASRPRSGRSGRLSAATRSRC